MNRKTIIIVSALVLISLVLIARVIRIQQKEQKRINTLPKIAIVLDDWGYNTNNIDLLNSIDAPINISILPNLTYSKVIAVAVSKRVDREVMLHMPMEPEDNQIRLEDNTLLTSMDADTIGNLIDKALDTVENAKGISGHMGSKATQDLDLMGSVMDSAKLNNLYFLDSKSTLYSVAEEKAKGKIPYIKRDVFLDNDSNKEYINKQFDELIEKAKLQGYAIGIGHDKVNTLEVLFNRIPKVKDIDIKFVLVSELIER